MCRLASTYMYIMVNKCMAIYAVLEEIFNNKFWILVWNAKKCNSKANGFQNIDLVFINKTRN